MTDTDVKFYCNRIDRCETMKELFNVMREYFAHLIKSI